MKSIFSKATAQQENLAQSNVKERKEIFINHKIVEETDAEVVIVHLIFWADGLSVNDGPLRPYSDQATLLFLEQIRRE